MCFLHAFYHEGKMPVLKEKTFVNLFPLPTKTGILLSQKEVWQTENKTNFLRYRQLLNVCPLENVGSYNKIVFAIQKVKYYFTSAHYYLSLLFLKCEKVVPEMGEKC